MNGRVVSFLLSAVLMAAIGCGGTQGEEITPQGAAQPVPEDYGSAGVASASRGLHDSGHDWDHGDHRGPGCSDPWLYSSADGSWECTAWMGTHWYTETRFGIQNAAEAALWECRRYQWYERCHVDCCYPADGSWEHAPF